MKVITVCKGTRFESDTKTNETICYHESGTTVIDKFMSIAEILEYVESLNSESDSQNSSESPNQNLLPNHQRAGYDPFYPNRTKTALEGDRNFCGD